ncbi:hypothetical protein V8G54_003185 [Vigna mungo]|uniref:Uncharacterized protein n=1 Tax=Vigna mungo TaxID=3915 RepID=A0AAQ3P9L9_VIGMU
MMIGKRETFIKHRTCVPNAPTFDIKIQKRGGKERINRNSIFDNKPMNPLSLVQPPQAGAGADHASHCKLIPGDEGFLHSVEQGPGNDVAVWYFIEGALRVRELGALSVGIDEGGEEEAVGREGLGDVAVCECGLEEVTCFGAGFEDDGEEDVVVRGGMEGVAHQAVDRNDVVVVVIEEVGADHDFEGVEVAGGEVVEECAGAVEDAEGAVEADELRREEELAAEAEDHQGRVSAEVGEVECGRERRRRWLLSMVVVEEGAPSEKKSRSPGLHDAAGPDLAEECATLSHIYPNLLTVMPWSRNCVEEATIVKPLCRNLVVVPKDACLAKLFCRVPLEMQEVAIANYRSFIVAADALIVIRHEVSSIDNHLESLDVTFLFHYCLCFPNRRLY